jgi:hypothetical protein
MRETWPYNHCSVEEKYRSIGKRIQFCLCHRLSPIAIILPIICGACSTTRYTTVTDNAFRQMRRLEEIDAELANVGQIMVYAGRFHQAPLANLALDAALEVLGMPDDRESAYAENISAVDIQGQCQNIRNLQREKHHCQIELGKSMAVLREDMPKLQWAHNTISLLRWATIIGGLFIAGIFLRHFL